MANSQTDMDDWVKAIRRVIWAPFGGGKQGQEDGERRDWLGKVGGSVTGFIHKGWRDVAWLCGSFSEVGDVNG